MCTIGSLSTAEILIVPSIQAACTVLRVRHCPSPPGSSGIANEVREACGGTVLQGCLSLVGLGFFPSPYLLNFCIPKVHLAMPLHIKWNLGYLFILTLVCDRVIHFEACKRTKFCCRTRHLLLWRKNPVVGSKCCVETYSSHGYS